jgi:hypothetical protein
MAVELLERYLQSIGRQLPAKGRDDTLEELRANLLAEIEEREEQTGTQLREDEVVEVLRRHGKPSVVAARYQPQQYFIGPEVFPFYWFTMRRIFPWVILAAVVSQAVMLIYLPYPRPVATAIWSVFVVLFYFLAWNTLTFGLIDFIRVHYPQKIHLPDTWDPRKLPKVESKEGSGLPKHPVADLIVSVAAVLWLLAIPRYPFLLFGPGAVLFHRVPLEFAHVCYTFYWTVVALNCLQIVLKVIAMSARALPWRRWMKIAEQVFGLAPLFVLLQAREYILLAKPVSDASRYSWVAPANAAMHSGLELVAVIAILKVAWEVWKVLSSRQANHREYAAVK